MDNKVNEIHKNAWVSIQDQYRVIIDKMRIYWDPTEETQHDFKAFSDKFYEDIDWYDQNQANFVLDVIEQKIKTSSLVDDEYLDEEDEDTLEGILNNETLRDSIKRVSSMILRKDSEGVVDSISELRQFAMN